MTTIQRINSRLLRCSLHAGASIEHTVLSTLPHSVSQRVAPGVAQLRLLVEAYGMRLEDVTKHASEARETLVGRIADTRKALMDEMTIIRKDEMGENLPYMDCVAAKSAIDQTVTLAMQAARSKMQHGGFSVGGWADGELSKIPEAWKGVSDSVRQR